MCDMNRHSKHTQVTNRHLDCLSVVVSRCCACHFDLSKTVPLTFDDGVVAAPVQENAHGFITTIVHLVSLNIDTNRIKNKQRIVCRILGMGGRMFTVVTD